MTNTTNTALLAAHMAAHQAADSFLIAYTAGTEAAVHATALADALSAVEAITDGSEAEEVSQSYNGFDASIKSMQTIFASLSLKRMAAILLWFQRDAAMEALDAGEVPEYDDEATSNAFLRLLRSIKGGE
jgi:hypothetical protein